MSTRILSTSPLVGPHLKALGARHPELVVAPWRSLAWKAGLAKAEALLVLLSEPLSAEDLALCPNLRVLATYSVGVNHLPLETCKERGIRVLSTPGVLTDATADLALTLLLALSRRVSEGEALVRAGQWRGWAPDLLLGRSLQNRTCGILGSGPIGRAFAHRVRALGMKPLFWDREGQHRPVDYGAGIARRVPLEELLAHADVLSLHCPLTDATRGLLDEAHLRLLPRGACLINTARGGILDEAAAIRLLHEGHLGGVGLDVYKDEPELMPDWLTAPNTVLLPHLGSATRETREDMARILCDGIAAVLDGTD